MKTVLIVFFGVVIGQLIFRLALRFDENLRKRKEDELEHLKRVLIKDKIRKDILGEKKWSVTDYLSRMEKAWDKIQKERPEPYKLTLWLGQNGLRLNDDGTTEWVKKEEKKRLQYDPAGGQGGAGTTCYVSVQQSEMVKEQIEQNKEILKVLGGNAEVEELERTLRLGAYKTNCKNAYCCPIKICRTGEVMDAIIEPHEIEGPKCGRNAKGEIVRDYIGVKHKVITIKPIPMETQKLLDEELFTYITIMGDQEKTIEVYLGNSHTLIEK